LLPRQRYGILSCDNFQMIGYFSGFAFGEYGKDPVGGIEKEPFFALGGKPFL